MIRWASAFGIAFAVTGVDLIAEYDGWSVGNIVGVVFFVVGLNLWNDTRKV